jgi:hypothetical protein
MIKQGDRTQKNYRRSETLPINPKGDSQKSIDYPEGGHDG